MKALGGERALGPRGLVPGDDLEALVPILGAGRDVDRVAVGVRHVEVQVGFLLVVDPRMEPRGALLVGHHEGQVLVGAGARLVRPQRRVDRVVHVEVHVGLAPGRARVPREVARRSLDARHRGGVEDVRAELRGEAAGEELAEGEAVGIVQNLGQSGLVRDHAVVGDPDLGAARRSVEHAVGRVEHVADQQDPLVGVVAGSEDAAAGAGVAEVEAPLDLLAHEVAVGVERRVVVEQVAHVGPQLDFVGDLRGAPYLRGHAHAPVPGRDQRQRVVALGAAVGVVRVSVFAGQVQETALAQRKPHVARDGVHLAVARDGSALEAFAGDVLGEEIAARLELERAPGAVVPQARSS